MEFAAVPADAIAVIDEAEDEDVDKSPVVTIHRMRQQLCKADPVQEDVLFWKNSIRVFLLKEIASETDCIDIKHGIRTTNCRCKAAINHGMSEDEIVRATEYCFGYALLPKIEQQTLLKEWIKYADTISKAYRRGDILKRAAYILPGTTHLICKDALCRLLGVGKFQWTTVITLAKKNTPPTHGLIGREGNKLDRTLEQILSDYFGELQTLAQPRATLVVRSLVRDQVQTELREDDQTIVELPSHMTKRSLYNRLLLELGWKCTYDSKSRIVETLPVDGVEQDHYPSWGSFRRYWSKHYPKLFIAGAREDVCNQCYVYANRHRYFAKSKEGEVQDGDDDGNEEEHVATMERGEQLVIVAARHVEMAQQQRALYQQKRKEAKDTIGNRPSERVLCYVADYAQNMYIPNFAGEQPGATYYYSPMSCYVFGVVDAAVDKLAAWLYTEATAKKGGNNVASLLMNHLDHYGIASTGEPYKEINFVMDNCGGQNKNRQVLRLMHFIVKRKIAVVARAIFLVRGHTKNACDRLFNTMKRQYRKCNSFTPEDLVQSMQGNANVEAFMVEDVFKNWDTLEDTMIKRIPSGNTTTNHIFTVDINRNNGNSMYLQQANGSDELELKLVKPPFLVDDDAFKQQPSPIPVVGLQDIKWKELHDKWAKYVPEKKKKEWRYYHEAPPKDKIEAVAKQSKEARQQRKKRARTVHEEEKKQVKKKKSDSNNDSKDADGTTGVI
jgi:hypothetical protein